LGFHLHRKGTRGEESGTVGPKFHPTSSKATGPGGEGRGVIEKLNKKKGGKEE